MKGQYSVETLQQLYTRACEKASDINEHVPTLRALASQCRVVREFGVRGGVSTTGVLLGACEYALSHPEEAVEVLGYDLSAPARIYKEASRGIQGVENLRVAFHVGNVLHTPPVPCDMLFIDTFHVYGQLRRELEQNAPSVSKFIAMHDTTVDGERSEYFRRRFNIGNVSNSTGFTESELKRGLWEAVTEFLTTNSTTWKLQHRYENNNGLTVLERIGW